MALDAVDLRKTLEWLRGSLVDIGSYTDELEEHIEQRDERIEELEKELEECKAELE